MANVFKNLKENILFKPIIQIHGDGEVIAEGCGNVVEYTNERIIFNSKRKIEITGQDLIMTNLGCGYVSICGKINCVKLGE